MRRLAGVTDADPMGGQLSVGAGTTVADVQAAAASAGWAYGVDLASRDTATIGGTVATNAGGLQVLRHGSTRAQLVGFEVVLGTGETVSHMGGLLKDNTGYDLGGLLCGSEGTLGVVTAARLRLVPQSPESVTAILAFSSVAAAVDAASLLRRSLPELQSLEFSPARAGPGLPSERHRSTIPWNAPGLPVGRGGSSARPRARHGNGARFGFRRRRRCRGHRPRPEGTALALSRGAYRGDQHVRCAPKLDVTLPAPMLAAFIDHVPDVVKAADPRATTWLFGHVGDGNVHVNVTGLEPDDSAVDDRVMHYAAELGGSISSEHGIGTAKRPWLHLNRSDPELAAFRRLKTALDPAGILNPNVLLPAES